MESVLIVARTREIGMEVVDFVVKARNEAVESYHPSMGAVKTNYAKYYIVNAQAPFIRGFRANYIVFTEKPTIAQAEKFAIALVLNFGSGKTLIDQIALWDADEKNLTKLKESDIINI